MTYAQRYSGVSTDFGLELIKYVGVQLYTDFGSGATEVEKYVVLSYLCICVVI